MFYGFRSPGKNDVVFNIAGDEQQIRLLDYAARALFVSAVQSTKRAGIRHYYAKCVEFGMWRLVAAVSRCKPRRVLRPIAWMLGLLLSLVTVLAVRAENTDFNQRKFVKDSEGNFTLMFRGADCEHNMRTLVSQLALRIVSEKFPPGAYRLAKPATDNDHSYTFKVGGRTTTVHVG
ncbi:MAG TPA: hypothetical protein VKK81_16015 [Candidatus Binatia bacterium]|nr:hypothetical protein [Candidatus Binatia bacterium]